MMALEILMMEHWLIWKNLIGLMEWLVRHYSERGHTVLDFCMGSGSTGVACVNVGRSFVGFEIDEKYFNIAVGRIENDTRQGRFDFDA